MPGISNTALVDLTRTTLENLPKMNFEVALDYQNYPVVNQWFRSDKMQSDGGTSIKRNIILDTSGNARFVRLYQKTPINVADVHQQITAEWVQAQTHWSIERREALRNKGPAAYVKLVQTRRLDGMLDLADLLETKAWSTPSSSSDDLNPQGLPYWLSMREASSSGQGFDAYRVRYTGGTTSTTKGGIDGSTTANTKWRNYAATYTAVNADFVQRMRRAFHATGFQSPMLAKDMTDGPKSSFRIYMGLDTLSSYEDLTTKANDNIGRDLDPFHGNTTFRRVPIIYTPAIDSATYTPVYAVNHAKFYPIVESGNWLRESDPMSDVEQHNTVTTFVDCSFQFFCQNVRQGGFVLHTVTA